MPFQIREGFIGTLYFQRVEEACITTQLLHAEGLKVKSPHLEPAIPACCYQAFVELSCNNPRVGEGPGFPPSVNPSVPHFSLPLQSKEA